MIPSQLQPSLRRAAALLWSGFLGAACSISVLLSLPESWLAQGGGLRELSLLFFVCWALALVPALSAQLLALPPRSRPR